jgi:hypothetical protein
MRSIRFQRQVAEFINDQELRFCVVHQALLEPARMMRLGQRRNERRRGSEQARWASSASNSRDELSRRDFLCVLPYAGRE